MSLGEKGDGLAAVRGLRRGDTGRAVFSESGDGSAVLFEGVSAEATQPESVRENICGPGEKGSSC